MVDRDEWLSNVNEYYEEGTMQRRVRRGLEVELWRVIDERSRYRRANFRSSDRLSHLGAFSRTLFDLGGTFEFARNLLELRTHGGEEHNSEELEANLLERISALRGADSRTAVIGGGCYAGYDEPEIDLGEDLDRNGRNLFWLEMGLVFPDIFTSRFIASNQVNLSVADWTEDEIVDTYNVVAGISPVLISAFSTSPVWMGIDTGYWNKREHIVSLRSSRRTDMVLDTAYPLYSLRDYRVAVARKVEQASNALCSRNPAFFCSETKDPVDTIRRYRGMDWAAEKLVTDQVVRLNYSAGATVKPFVEIRCIDAQESPKTIASLSRLGERIVGSIRDLRNMIPQSREELLANIGQAIRYGPNATIRINQSEKNLHRYTCAIGQLLFGHNPTDRYDRLLLDRFNNPPGGLLRELCRNNKNIPRALEVCMSENRALCEVV